MQILQRMGGEWHNHPSLTLVFVSDENERKKERTWNNLLRRICSETPPSGDAVREGTRSVSLSPAAIPRSEYENNDTNDQDQHIVVSVYFNDKTKID